MAMPTYDAAPYIKRAIESALAETLPPNEIIVVDDASSDGSAEIAESFGSAVTVCRRLNGGCDAARHSGISMARFEWIALSDAARIKGRTAGSAHQPAERLRRPPPASAASRKRTVNLTEPMAPATRSDFAIQAEGTPGADC